MLKSKSIILIAIALIILLTAAYFSFFSGDPVETSDEAIAIAKTYVHEKYNNDFSEYIIKTETENGNWIVYYLLGESILGGGGPEVYIRKYNGRIIKSFLQK